MRLILILLLLFTGCNDNWPEGQKSTHELEQEFNGADLKKEIDSQIIAACDREFEKHGRVPQGCPPSEKEVNEVVYPYTDKNGCEWVDKDTFFCPHVLSKEQIESMVKPECLK